MKKMKHFYLRFSIGVILAFYILFHYWYYIDGVYVNKVLSLNKVIYKTEQLIYYPGEIVLGIPSGLCKYRNIPADIYTNFIDGYKIPFDKKTMNMPIGCNNGELRPLERIPDFVTPRQGKFVGEFRYKINPIKTLIIPFETNYFTIKDFGGKIK